MVVVEILVVVTVAVISAADVVGPAVTLEGVVAVRIIEGVVPRSSFQGVIAVPSVQDVVAVAADQGILARAPGGRDGDGCVIFEPVVAIIPQEDDLVHLAGG